MAEQNTARERYETLARKRDPYLRRAREYAKVTIPSLLPPANQSATADLPETYQGFGARLVTGLASRAMTAFYPVGKKSFRLQVPSHVLVGEIQQVDEGAETERGLALTEDLIQSEIERKRWRRPTYLAIQHLIVTGNALEQMMPDNSIRVFRLDQFVVVRDPEGKLTEFVVQEMLSPDSLPEDLRDMVGDEGRMNEPSLPLYTWGEIQSDGTWTIHQEFEDQTVPESEGDYDINPFRHLIWSEVLGEDYGRSKVEEHYGDFKLLDGLSMSVKDGAAMASRNVTLIRPNATGGLNLRRRLTRANNGDFVVGNPDDVEPLQFKNVPGVEVAATQLGELKQELASAFLLNSSARRDAERVTAFELRKMIEEIESVLGGVFTSLQEEIQENRLKRLMLQMKAQKALPDFPDDMVEPVILTGLEALGQEKEFEKIATAQQFLSTMPEEIVQIYIKWSDLLNKGLAAIDLPDVVRSEDEAQQKMQELMQKAMAERAAGPAAGQLAKGATDQQQSEG